MISRREFLRRAVIAGTATVTLSTAGRAESRRIRSPNEKLNIGVVGVGGRGGDNLHAVSGENIVALCDIDSHHLDRAMMQYPSATRYSDYRRMLEKNDLDAVVVSTPDHTHAIPVVLALKAGLDVYCEKPLAHSVWEVRQIRDAARRKRAVTQMGTQIHAGENYRRAVEIVQSGMLGPVRRVYVWHANSVRPGVRVTQADPPAHIDYDLWLGPSEFRPFHESHFHFNWRYWFDFGGGILADMACHFMDLPYWALGLKNVDAVQTWGEKTYVGDNDVPDNARVDYYFPARGDDPPVQVTWYHGRWRPEWAAVYAHSSAVLFEGERGRLIADYDSRKIYLEPGLQADVPPPSIPPSIGHHREWIEACKSRAPTTCNFDYSGALAETVLLGNVSYRCGGKRLEWNARRLRAMNCPEATQFIRPPYRKGWSL
jgi:predicted dehydrogenase